MDDELTVNILFNFHIFVNFLQSFILFCVSYLITETNILVWFRFSYFAETFCSSPCGLSWSVVCACSWDECVFCYLEMNVSSAVLRWMCLLLFWDRKNTYFCPLWLKVHFKTFISILIFCLYALKIVDNEPMEPICFFTFSLVIS